MSRDRRRAKPAPGVRERHPVPSATQVRLDEAGVWIGFSNGRTIPLPLSWFPPLLDGRADQATSFSASSRDLHWDVVGSDISFNSLMASLNDLSAGRSNSESAGVRIALHSK